MNQTNRIGIVWIIIAAFYFVYSAIIAKHGFMFFNTAITVAMIIIGGYCLAKR